MVSRGEANLKWYLICHLHIIKQDHHHHPQKKNTGEKRLTGNVKGHTLRKNMTLKKIKIRGSVPTPKASMVSAY